MKPFVSLILLGATSFLISCEQKNSSTKETETPKISAQSVSETEADFTPWMSRAELQFFQENNPADHYFAQVEGRNHGGRLEYRALNKLFPADDYDQWGVFWGITETELFDWELRLLKGGFSRSYSQFFADPTGKILHQIVWLKPKGHTGESSEPVETVVGEREVARLSKEAWERSRSERQPEPVENPPTELAVEVASEVPPPTEPPVPEKAASPVIEKVEPSPKTSGPTYIVKAGDTLGKIAKNQKVSLENLKTANHLKSDLVRIGQKLVIPK
jgi:hypothetical protein